MSVTSQQVANENTRSTDWIGAIGKTITDIISTIRQPAANIVSPNVSTPSSSNVGIWIAVGLVVLILAYFLFKR